MSKYLFVGDMHVGSSYALMPPKFESTIASNLQKKIYGYWKQMVKDVGKVDVLVLMGDIIDGVGKNSNGREMWSTDVDKQIRCALELLKMIDFDKSVAVYGSEYHVEGNLNADQVLARELGCTYQGWELILKPQNSREKIHVSHNISVSSSAWQYRTTAIARELMFSLLNEREIGMYKCIVRGHAHYYVFVQYSSNMGWVNPCWQARTPYLVKKGLALVPKLGYTVLEVEDNDIWRHDVRTFSIPPPEVGVL